MCVCVHVCGILKHTNITHTVCVRVCFNRPPPLAYTAYRERGMQSIILTPHTQHMPRTHTHVPMAQHCNSPCSMCGLCAAWERETGREWVCVGREPRLHRLISMIRQILSFTMGSDPIFVCKKSLFLSLMSSREISLPPA
jgi:hypothetical protein